MKKIRSKKSRDTVPLNIINLDAVWMKTKKMAVYVVSGVLLCMCESEASFLHVHYVQKSPLLSPLHKRASPTR